MAGRAIQPTRPLTTAHCQLLAIMSTIKLFETRQVRSLWDEERETVTDCHGFPLEGDGEAIQVLPIHDALRHELGWPHYRALRSVEDEPQKPRNNPATH